MNTAETTRHEGQQFVAILKEDMARRRAEALEEAHRALVDGASRRWVIERLARRFTFWYVWASLTKEDRRLARVNAAARLNEFLAQQIVVTH